MAFWHATQAPKHDSYRCLILAARSIGRGVFIRSPTKVPAPTRCEQRTLPTAANTAWAHAPLNSRDALAAPKGASSLRYLWDMPPPLNRSSSFENGRVLRQTCPPQRSTVTTFRCLRNNSWFSRCSTLLCPHLCQGACQPMTVRRILSSTLAQ